MINTELINLIKQESKLFSSLVHGLPHWKTVERNGLYIAQFSGADRKVVCYFAYFHDCKRLNEFSDPEHGPRAARFLKQIQSQLNLTNDQFDDLYHAVGGHTHGRQPGNETISTCWDADRLDIGRVGMIPNSKYLFSAEARRIADEDDQQVLLDFGYISEIYQ